MTIAIPNKTAKTSPCSGARCGSWLDILALTLILGLNWICYVRVINGYFLADDFLHVAYLKHVFDGDWYSLLRNFWGNWMQAEGTTFYRPLISLTLAFDYCFFGANAAGFHLSNLFFQTACSLLLYLVVTQMGRLFILTDSKETAFDPRLGALAAACLFSVSPLHCEVVAWIISRVDSVCCMFYLASLSLFLLSLRQARTAAGSAVEKPAGTAARRPARLLLGLSLFCFALGLCSKEMAVTLPPTIALLMILTDSKRQESGLRLRFFSAFKGSLPFWIVLVVYLIFRTLALGTISGGYQGSIGEGLSSSLAKRWLFDGSFVRVLFPLNQDVFGNGHGLFKTLKVLYILAAGGFAVALFTARSKTPAIKSLTFGFGWLVLTLLPTYQVWNLTETLQGSRFIYFGTMPLSYILSLMVIPPLVARFRSMARLLPTLQLILLAFFVLVFGTITSKNNQPWQHAMKELKAFQEALCHLADKLPNKNIVLLNIPQSYRGAHMLYNGATMSVILQPPLAKKDIVSQIYTFEPATFGDADLISISRLRRLMAVPNASEKVSESLAVKVQSRNANVLYLWDREKLRLEPVNLGGGGPSQAKDSEILFQSAAVQSPLVQSASAQSSLINQSAVKGDAPLLLTSTSIALSPPIDLPASHIDAIIVKLSPLSWQNLKALKNVDSGKNAALCLSFKGDNMTMPILESADSGEIVFQLSEHKNWLKQGMVHELSIKTLGCPSEVEVVSIEAINQANQLPQVEADGTDLVEGPDGICRVHGPRPTFNYDVSNVPGAVSAVCEISKPNSWFEHYSGTLRDRETSKHALFVAPFNKLKGRNILLSFAGIKDHGFYEIKVAAVDKDGKVLSYFSDPLNFQI